MKNLNLFIILILVAAMSSCISTKKLTYLQDTDEALEVDTAGFHLLKRSYYKLQKNDLLSVQIRSLDPETDAYFQAGQNSQNLGNSGSSQNGSSQLYFNGYSVDQFGNIDIPVIGKVYIEGLSLNEVQKLLIEKLSAYFNTSTLFVKTQLSGIKFTIIGEISRPGQYYIYQNEANIFEAIAQAGDIQMVGKRQEVQIIRQHPQGVKYYEIDLTSKAVISNPMYFIQPNDIINIKPMKQKSWGIGETGFQTYATLLSIITSTLTFILFIQSFGN